MANPRGFYPRNLTEPDNGDLPWLNLARKELDEAVLDSYAWPHDLTGDQVLERLLALNLERAASQEDT